MSPSRIIVERLIRHFRAREYRDSCNRKTPLSVRDPHARDRSRPAGLPSPTVSSGARTGRGGRVASPCGVGAGGCLTAGPGEGDTSPHGYRTAGGASRFRAKDQWAPHGAAGGSGHLSSGRGTSHGRAGRGPNSPAALGSKRNKVTPRPGGSRLSARTAARGG